MMRSIAPALAALVLMLLGGNHLFSMSAEASAQPDRITLKQGKTHAVAFARQTAYEADTVDWTVRNCFVGDNGRAVYCTAAWTLAGFLDCTQALKVVRHGSRYSVRPKRTSCN